MLDQDNFSSSIKAEYEKLFVSGYLADEPSPWQDATPEKNSRSWPRILRDKSHYPSGCHISWRVTLRGKSFQTSTSTEAEALLIRGPTLEPRLLALTYEGHIPQYPYAFMLLSVSWPRPCMRRAWLPSVEIEEIQQSYTYTHVNANPIW